MGGQFGGRNGQGTQQRSIRAGIKLGFKYTPVRTKTAARFEKRLLLIPRFSKESKVMVVAEGDVFVLTGTVPSEEDRALAERLARLEPGVSKIRNELKVVPTS